MVYYIVVTTWYILINDDSSCGIQVRPGDSWVIAFIGILYCVLPICFGHEPMPFFFFDYVRKMETEYYVNLGL